MFVMEMFAIALAVDLEWRWTRELKRWVPAIPVSLTSGRTRNLETEDLSQMRMRKYSQIKKECLKWSEIAL